MAQPLEVEEKKRALEFLILEVDNHLGYFFRVCCKNRGIFTTNLNWVVATQIIFYFHPAKMGKMNPIRRAYFSEGLVQPPTSGVTLADSPGNIDVLWGLMGKFVMTSTFMKMVKGCVLPSLELT